MRPAAPGASPDKPRPGAGRPLVSPGMTPVLGQDLGKSFSWGYSCSSVFTGLSCDLPPFAYLFVYQDEEQSFKLPGAFTRICIQNRVAANGPDRWYKYNKYNLNLLNGQTKVTWPPWAPLPLASVCSFVPKQIINVFAA